MLLVRFLVTLLLMVAAAVFAIVADAWWLVAIALLLLIAATISVVLTVLRYTGGDEWLGPEEEAELTTEHLVEHESGLPIRHRWNDRRTREYAEEVARRGVVAVPDGWRGPDGAHRILLVATEPITAEQLRTALPDERANHELAVLVVAPALASSARSYAVGGATEAVHHAEEVARTTVAALRAAGIHTSGHIGPTDPAVAVSDGLRTYAAEQVVVARHRQPPMRHLEDVPLDAAAEAFGVPLRELALDPVT